MDKTRYIQEHMDESIKIIEQTKTLAPKIIEAAEACVAALKNGGIIFTCGNGGSAADAQHITAELINMYRNNKRAPLASVSLTTDASVLTSISNDFGADLIFAKQVRALCHKKDILIAISTSGNSANVLKAMDAAKEKGTTIICLTGESGGKMKAGADILINIPGKTTPHIQEAHLPSYHLLCDLIEREFSER